MHTPHHEDPESPLTNESGESSSKKRPAAVEEESAGVLGGKRTDADPPTGGKLSDLIYILDEDVPEDGAKQPDSSASSSAEGDEEEKTPAIGPLADTEVDESLLEEGVAPSPSIRSESLPNLPDDSLSGHEDTLVTNIEALRDGGVSFEPESGAEGESFLDAMSEGEGSLPVRDGLDDGFGLDEDYESSLHHSTPSHPSYHDDAMYEHDRPPTAEELAANFDDTDDLYGAPPEDELVEEGEEPVEETSYDDFTHDDRGQWYDEAELPPEASLVLVSTRHKLIPWAVGLVVVAAACFGVGGYLYQTKLDAEASWSSSEAAANRAATEAPAQPAQTPAPETLPPLTPQQNADLGSTVGLVVAQATTLPFEPVTEPTPLVDPEPTPQADVETTPPVVTLPEDPSTRTNDPTTPEARPPFDDPQFSGEFTRSVPEPSPQTERSRRRVNASLGDATIALRTNNNAFRGRIYEWTQDSVSLEIPEGLVSFALDDVLHVVPRDGLQPIDIQRDEPVASGRKGNVVVEYSVQPRVAGDSFELAAADADLVSTIQVDVARALGDELAEPEAGPEPSEDDPPLALPKDGQPELPATPTSNAETGSGGLPTPPPVEKGSKKGSREKR